MSRTQHQTPVDISGTAFPRFTDSDGNPTERFWYAKDEFILHSHSLLTEGQMFTSISARRVGARWTSTERLVTTADVASFVWKMRLFYLKSESMSIHSMCTYMEKNVINDHVNLFFRHMRESWEEQLRRPATLLEGYSGDIKTNKQLIDALLYSGNFHSQEKYKRRYGALLEFMDESLILMSAYNAMHSGYQLKQISRALSELREDNPVILLPDHLRHEWDRNCPYQVIR